MFLLDTTDTERQAGDFGVRILLRLLLALLPLLLALGESLFELALALEERVERRPEDIARLGRLQARVKRDPAKRRQLHVRHPSRVHRVKSLHAGDTIFSAHERQLYQDLS